MGYLENPKPLDSFKYKQHPFVLVGSSIASFTNSMITSADHPGLTFSLRLIRSEPTYNQPMQQWSFVSDFAVSDKESDLGFLSAAN